jgi:hypothetical protein
MNWLDRFTYRLAGSVNAACWLAIAAMSAVLILYATGAPPR